MSAKADSLRLRSTPRSSDPDSVERILGSNRLFSAEEITVARELVEDRIVEGSRSEYHLLFADRGGETLAFACFGSVPLTRSSWDLYWIAVEHSHRGRGLGSRLLAKVETLIEARGGERLYIETSGRPDYEDTRRFYESHRCQRVAEYPDFYAPGDDKVVFMRRLREPHAEGPGRVD
jgi:ribosomal protein S18 acetylase RimI-like enzyme